MAALDQRVVWLVSLLPAVSIMAGCESTPGPSTDFSSIQARFNPAVLEVHTLSHIYARDDEVVVLDVAIELLDSDGFSTRGTGTLEIELHQGDRDGEAIMLRRTWSRDLNDAAVNAATFDDATRTYIVQEQLEYAEVPRSPRLTASLYQPGGATLTDSSPLPVLGPGLEDRSEAVEPSRQQ